MGPRSSPWTAFVSLALAGCLAPDDPAPAARIARRAVVLAAAVSPLALDRGGENPLDVGEARTAPPPRRAPPPPPAPSSTNRKVRTPADEDLPAWVPISGRLTVVESSDLAENLGLVPMGSAKKSAERISVADKLEEERAARAAKIDVATGPPTWTFIPGGAFVDAR